MDKEPIAQHALSILSKIQESTTVLVHFHVNPDQDSYGSALAMYHALKQLGKDVTVIKGDNDLLSYLSPLPGYDQITEKNFFEVDVAGFDLFIVLDSARPDRISRRGDVVFPDSLSTICIDHHENNNTPHDIDLILPDAPSTTSILYHLFKEWQLDINDDIATCLLAGLYGDTGDFTNNATTPDALAIAGDLASKHPRSLDTMQAIRNNGDKRILLLWQAALNSLETHFNDSIVLTCVSHNSLSEHNIRQEHIEQAALNDQMAGIHDWDIVVGMLEMQPGLVRVSFRTRNPKKYNVADIAQSLGGGGHAGAAGVLFENTSLEEAKKQILATLEPIFSAR